jgi:hypothetical protein
VGTPAAEGSRPRQLVEAVSSGHIDQAAANVPAVARPGVVDSAREGFLAGFNDILMLGGILAIAGAVLALWLIREEDIERESPIEVEPSFVPPEAQPGLVAA